MLGNWKTINKIQSITLLNTFKHNLNVDKQQALRVLQVSEGASHEQIRKAFHRLAERYHPDKLGVIPDTKMQESAQKMAEVNAAYQALSSQMQENGRNSEPAAPSDFFSTLRKVSPEGPTGPSRKPVQAPAYYERKAEPKPVSQKHKPSPDELDTQRRARQEKMVLREMRAAKPEESEYLDILYGASRHSYVRFPESGFLPIAKEIISLDYPKERKIAALGLLSKCYLVPSEFVAGFISDICTAGKEDSDEKFHKVLGVLAGSYFYSDALLVDAYPCLSRLEGKTLSEVPRFMLSLNTIGVSILFGKDLEKLIEGTLAHTKSLSDVLTHIVAIKKHMCGKRGAEVYLETLPLIFCDDKNKKLIQSIMEDLIRLSELKDIEEVISRMKKYPGDLQNIRDLSKKACFGHPFRNLPPLASYSSLEHICLETIEKGDSTKAVLKFLDKMHKFKKASLSTIENETIWFFDMARKNGQNSNAVVDSFGSFLTNKSMSGPAWTKDMRHAYSALTVQSLGATEYDKEKLRLILSGFFASLPR
jgi:hypothetical protein